MGSSSGLQSYSIFSINAHLHGEPRFPLYQLARHAPTHHWLCAGFACITIITVSHLAIKNRTLLSPWQDFFLTFFYFPQLKASPRASQYTPNPLLLNILLTHPEQDRNKAEETRKKDQEQPRNGVKRYRKCREECGKCARDQHASMHFPANAAMIAQNAGGGHGTQGKRKRTFPRGILGYRGNSS